MSTQHNNGIIKSEKLKRNNIKFLHIKALTAFAGRYIDCDLMCFYKHNAYFSEKIILSQYCTQTMLEVV